MKCDNCIKLIELYGTAEHIAPWHCKCSEKKTLDNVQARLDQLASLPGILSDPSGNWCYICNRASVSCRHVPLQE